MTFLRGMFIAHPFTPRTSFIPISIGRYVYQIEGEDFDFPEIITDGSFAPTRRLMGHHATQNKNGTVPPCASLRPSSRSYLPLHTAPWLFDYPPAGPKY